MNMAPMAGGIAYGQKDWFVFRFCFFKGFIAPWVPVYRVIVML